jgi:protein-disulfide isomerase
MQSRPSPATMRHDRSTVAHYKYRMISRHQPHRWGEEMQDNNNNNDDASQAAYPKPALGEAGKPPESTRRQAQPRGPRLGAAAALITIATTVIATSGASSNNKRATTAKSINTLLAGIPQLGNTLGSATAPVTLQYFGDLECSTARTFTLNTLPLIVRKWVRSGTLRIEYRSLRTVSAPDPFGNQQVAALAAGRQDKQWYYLEYFYHEQGQEHSDYVNEDFLRGLAQQVPSLNLELWRQDRRDPRLTAQVVQDEQTAQTSHLHSTPSFLVGPTGSPPTLKLGQFARFHIISTAVQEILHPAQPP